MVRFLSFLGSFKNHRLFKRFFARLRLVDYPWLSRRRWTELDVFDDGLRDDGIVGVVLHHTVVPAFDILREKPTVPHGAFSINRLEHA
jgi:hypothetical protein